MAEQKYVLVRMEDYEDIVKIGSEGTMALLERVYGQLTGDSFISKGDHWDIDPKRALEAAWKLYDILSINSILAHSGYPEPYDDYVITDSELDLLIKVLNDRDEGEE